MNKPKVSIIVPVYKVEKYLPKCLDSLINQTLKDIEIICVNDGSPDNSLQILEKYASKDNRIIIISQQNQGLSAARNCGINKASGEYIGFVDSDDWVDLDFYEKLYNAANENDCDIACAGFKRCRKIKSSIKKSYENIKTYTDINEKVKIDNLPDHNYVWNKIYRHSKWNFEFPTGRVFEDMASTIKILFYLKKLVTVPDTYYNYRKTPNSIVTQQSIKNKQDYEWAKAELYNFAEVNNIMINNKKGFNKKEVFKFFGFTILKIYYYKNVTKYKFLGFIPFLSKTEF